jgi:hypothetical protein
MDLPFKEMNKIAQLQSTEGFIIEVRVINKKNSYGNDRYLIEPIAGKGQKWVDAGRLKFNE